MVLPAGTAHGDLTLLKFNDRIHSLHINRAQFEPLESPQVTIDGEQERLDPNAPATAAPIPSIPLVIKLYNKAVGGVDSHDVEFNLVDTPHLTLVEPSNNMDADFGHEWNDVTAAVTVEEGPNYAGEQARLYVEAQPDGGGFGSWHDFAPGLYLNLGQIGFGGVSAVGIVPPIAPLNRQSLTVVNSVGAESGFNADRFVGTMTRSGVPLAIAAVLAESVEKTAFLNSAVIKTSQLRRVADLSRENPWDPRVAQILRPPQ